MTTPPIPPNARGSQPNAGPSLLTRWKLSEPVRLYAWPVVVLLVVSAVAGGLVSQDWAEWALPQLAAALGTGLAAEAARASVYSTAGHIDGLRSASARWAAATRAKALDL